MSRNVFTKVFSRGTEIENLAPSNWRSGRVLVILFSIPDLLKLYPDHEIIMDKYIVFKETDVCIKIEDYNYFVTNSENGKILLNNEHIVLNHIHRFYYAKLDNGDFHDRKEHYIYPWMIQSVHRMTGRICAYKIREDIPRMGEVHNYKSAKIIKNKKGMIWQ